MHIWLKMEVEAEEWHLDKNQQLLHAVVPLKAEAPVRAIPYPIKTAAGVAKRTKAVELAVVKEARAVALPVAVVSQSMASLKRKGTWTFKTWKREQSKIRPSGEGNGVEQ